MLKKLEFLHIDYNKLTTLNMSGNPALKDSGFVAANNHLDTLVLPNIPDFTVDAEVFYEQNPRTGFLLHPHRPHLRSLVHIQQRRGRPGL